MDGIVVRRVIPSDNSCLFNAVGYVMEHDKHKATELRHVIAATVASDPVNYSEAFLGKTNQDYCAWILDSDNWGGAIELSILAEYYGREIAAYDIQTCRFCYIEKMSLIVYKKLAIANTSFCYMQKVFPIYKICYAVYLYTYSKHSLLHAKILECLLHAKSISNIQNLLCYIFVYI
ncbi:hypothetical protein ACHQM5_008366 [Ranunculus cassubicifolius]